jgi:hypothetical protein
MKTLYLLRHGKSEWGDPGLDDHDRPLAARGERAAAVVGIHFAQQDYQPSLVLCSSARRTRETLESLLPHLPGDPELVWPEPSRAGESELLCAAWRGFRPPRRRSVNSISSTGGIWPLEAGACWPTRPRRTWCRARRPFPQSYRDPRGDPAAPPTGKHEKCRWGFEDRGTTPQSRSGPLQPLL